MTYPSPSHGLAQAEPPTATMGDNVAHDRAGGGRCIRVHGVWHRELRGFPVGLDDPYIRHTLTACSARYCWRDRISATPHLL